MLVEQNDIFSYRVPSYHSSLFIQEQDKRIYKTLFMLNSTEHEISTAHNNYNAENKDVKFLISNSLRVVYYHNTGLDKKSLSVKFGIF